MLPDTLPILSLKDRAWVWFRAHAEGPSALPWLAVVSFADAIFFPIAPEIFLVALMLAHPKRWKEYLLVAIPSSVIGAAVAYWIAGALFAQFGQPLLAFYHLEPAFQTAQHFIRGHVFITMTLGNFSPIPDKALVYAAGFLGANFIPFITGYFVGRGLRMGLAVYLAHRYGEQTLAIVNRYFLPFALAVLAVLVFLLVRAFR